jgi:TRAF3-interacting protein 1
MVVGKSLSVKPAKIVAGHEPEKTNEFLQCLAAAINKGVTKFVCNGRSIDREESGNK